MDEQVNLFISDFDSLKDPYNLFVDHYREIGSKKSKITAVAELAANRDVIEREIKTLHDTVDFWLQLIAEHLHSEQNTNDVPEEMQSEITDIVESITESVAEGKHISGPENAYEDVIDKAREFYSKLPEPAPYSTSDSLLFPGLEGLLRGIETIQYFGRKLRQVGNVLNVLNQLLERIIRKSYPPPEEFKRWEDMTDRELNDYGKELKRLGEKNRPVRQRVIDKAVEIIRQTDKSYLTTNGAAQRWLWYDPRIQEIGGGNSRGWIDQAIKNGELQKKLSAD